ncbi:DUF418 domain-containing protein, partial [Micromonospora sp. KC606]|uniref:DUF418 domain-containing protein n=1 Tax=Micromonospora sp. KC606 TaxID=2530379 RepID=UPI001045D563
ADRPAPRGPRALAPDLARGTMLLLIALAHAHMYLSGQDVGFRGYARDGSVIDRIVAGLQVTLVDGRALPMFAALFGYGFVQFASSRAAAGADWPRTRRLLRRRSWWLLAFGFCHALLLFFGDILGAYGLLGLLVVGVLRWRDRTLLLVAAGWILAYGAVYALNGAQIAEYGGPADAMATSDPVAAAGGRLALWSVLTVMLAIEVLTPFLIGVWAARRRLLEDLDGNRRTLRITAAAGLASAVIGGLPLALMDSELWTGAPASLAVPAYVLHGLTGLGGMGYAALVGLVARRATATPGRIVTALAACGQRSMTCYLLQSVVFVAVFVPYAGGMGTELGTAAASGIAVLTWLTTVLLAALLHRAHTPGPAEQLLRRLTHGSRRHAPVAARPAKSGRNPARSR